jgi:hypothetical protein
MIRNVREWLGEVLDAVLRWIVAVPTEDRPTPGEGADRG